MRRDWPFEGCGLYAGQHVSWSQFYCIRISIFYGLSSLSVIFPRHNPTLVQTSA